MAAHTAATPMHIHSQGAPTAADALSHAHGQVTRPISVTVAYAPHSPRMSPPPDHAYTGINRLKATIPPPTSINHAGCRYGIWVNAMNRAGTRVARQIIATARASHSRNPAAVAPRAGSARPRLPATRKAVTRPSDTRGRVSGRRGRGPGSAGAGWACTPRAEP